MLAHRMHIYVNHKNVEDMLMLLIKKYVIITMIIFMNSFIAFDLIAANIYVDNTLSANITNGTYSITSRNSSGNNGNAYRTIQAAVNAMTSGDDIFIRGGTYYEHDILIPVSKSGTSSNWSSIQSYPGEWAIINGQRLCATGATSPGAVIHNGNPNNHDNPSEMASYWKFERLEITGGGTPVGSGDNAGHGIYWGFGPIQVRYCYIHDNMGSWGDENPSGLGGCNWRNSTVEYNYFKNNGADNYTNNVFQITNMASYPEYGYAFGSNTMLWKNEIRYNYISGIAGGIRTKGTAWLTTTRNGTDTTNQTYGDKIHHNIIQQTSSSIPALFYQQDFAQIYNNIVDQTGCAAAEENWAIATSRVRSESRYTLWTSIYNNTVYNGAADLGGFADPSDSGTVAKIFIYNNILDNMKYTFAPIAYGATAAWAGYSPSTLMSITNLTIDRNYIYRTSNTPAVYVGNAPSWTGRYTVTEWEALKSGTNMYKQDYNSGNLLYNGTTGADKYRVRSAHTVEGSITISNGGAGINHPYISGVTIPSYIGAANPSDDAWVAGVLALNVTYFTNVTSGSTPTWIEGAGGTTTPDTTPPSAPTGVGLQILQ
jgi:hypothetical protein